MSAIGRLCKAVQADRVRGEKLRPRDVCDRGAGENSQAASDNNQKENSAMLSDIRPQVTDLEARTETLRRRL